MNILVTGSNGFIGKNLVTRLREKKDYKVIEFTKENNLNDLERKINKADFIFHLAGENRSNEEKDFIKNNINLTDFICKKLIDINKKIPIIFTSSSQADLKNIYGITKKKAEDLLKNLNKKNGNSIKIYRLVGVFGKWCKPNYNSVVATFCNSISSGKEIYISNPQKMISLIFIDDVICDFIKSVKNKYSGLSFGKINPIYDISLEQLGKTIKSFKETRNSYVIQRVGDGFLRKLYSTYLSYINIENCFYELESHIDNRGSFVEILKTSDSGQFSFLSAKPGVTRGKHYHHTKSEKFLVIKGEAKFEFTNLLNNQKKEIFTNDKKPILVETIPGWIHSIKNVGSEDLLVILWSNEIFDKENPDTFA